MALGGRRLVFLPDCRDVDAEDNDNDEEDEDRYVPLRQFAAAQQADILQAFGNGLRQALLNLARWEDPGERPLASWLDVDTMRVDGDSGAVSFGICAPAPQSEAAILHQVDAEGAGYFDTIAEVQDVGGYPRLLLGIAAACVAAQANAP